MLRIRLYLLRKAEKSPKIQALCRELARRDLGFFLRMFAWTFDPRAQQDTPDTDSRIHLPDRPFVPYDFQHHLLEQIVPCITHGEDFLVEKSRDMGVTWTIMLVFLHSWLFKSGFHALVGSRKEDLVDRRGDISTLFGKLRYAISWLPNWLLPEGFQPKRHDTHMKLVNPVNGNTITGESSNDQFGRGGRYTAVLLDEFPFWPMDDAAWAAVGQSTPCRIAVGTPYGMRNTFARLAHETPIQKARIHWRAHPQKDDRWFEQQKKRMTAEEIGRELEINYHLSLSNRVYSGYTSAHCGRFQPMVAKRVIRSWDFGFQCPACLFIQINDDGGWRVIREVVGNKTLLVDFAKRVLAESAALFEGCQFEDICDPAGAQRSDKSDQSSIEILNTLGIYPFYQFEGAARRIAPGIELVRMKLAEVLPDGSPGLCVDERCKQTISALEGGYRYASPHHELPLEEHPYEDVMDCLRYAICHKLSPRSVLKGSSQSPRHRARYQPYRGY
ncbi:MAG: hypothetical protein VKK59_02695 [Vampirovibrionales bacterium]|nr:hypothetical protein [Vampirovibrionales bacterium]